ncbi:MAG: AMP-binding protein [Bradymonadaceae bacterium]
MRNFQTHFWELLQKHKDATALQIVDSEGNTSTETFWEWTRRVQRIGVAFYEQGLEAGERVGLIAPNSRDWLDVAFGVWLAGGVVVPVPPDLDRDTTLACLGRSGCTWIVVADEEGYQRIRGQGTGIPDDLRWLLVDWDADSGTGDVTTLTQFLEKGRSLVARGRVDDLAERIYGMNQQDPALVLFDDPPGDDPHGVFYTGTSTAKMIDALGSSLPFGEDAKPAVLRSFADPRAFLVAAASLFEGRGLCLGDTAGDLRDRLDDVNPTHLVCGSDYLAETTREWRKKIQDAPEFLQNTAEDEDGSGSGLGKLLGTIGEQAAERLFYQPLRKTFGSNLRAILATGRMLPKDVEKVLEDSETAVLDVYGHPECGVSHLERPGSQKPGAVGRPVKGYKCRIDAPDDEGRGEVLIKSGFLFEDYWDGTGPKTTDEGWLRTGDTGRIENGRLFLES